MADRARWVTLALLLGWWSGWSSAGHDGDGNGDEVFAFDAERPARGFWIGDIAVGDAPGFAAVEIAGGDAGGWSVTATTIMTRALGVPAEEVRVEDDGVAFVVRTTEGELAFDGRVSADGQRLEGTLVLTRGGGPSDGSFELGRTVRAADLPGPIRLTGKVGLPGGGDLDVTLTFAETPAGGWVGALDIPQQRVEGYPLVDVRRDGRRLSATMRGPPDSTIEGELDTADRRFEGVMRQSGITLPLNVARNGRVELPAPERPQHPKPPFPYRSRDIVVPHPEGFSLAGTLTIPDGPGPHPAAVLISGSGQQDRDETLAGHKPFLVIADHLTRRGIAVMRYDDRGVARSSGSNTLLQATSRDFAGDAFVIFEHLKTEPGIDPARIGFVGHSEGGIIAPMVAGMTDDVAFMVLLAAPGVPGRDLIPLQMALGLEAAGAKPEYTGAFRRHMTEAIDLVLDGADEAQINRALEGAQASMVAAGIGASPGQRDIFVATQKAMLKTAWFRFFLAHDPGPALRRVKCPVLAANGTKDLQVWHEQNLDVIHRELRDAGADVTIERYEGLNHLFQPATTGAGAEYGIIRITFAERVLDDMAAWLGMKMGVGSVPPSSGEP